MVRLPHVKGLTGRSAVQTESEAFRNNAAAYDAKPWLAQYAPDVVATIEYPRQTICELLDEMAARYPTRAAFIFQNHVLTYRDVVRLSKQMSAALQRAGVGPGDVVFLLLPNMPHFPIAYYGALRLGAAVAAASPTVVEREVEGLIRDSGAKVVVTLDILFDKVQNVWQSAGAQAAVVGTATDFMPAWMRIVGRVTGRTPKPKTPITYAGGVRHMLPFLRSGRGDWAAPAGDPDAVAVLQYTGGTTGLPKAAVLSHANLLSNARQMVAWFPTLKQGEESILAVLPFFHVYGVTLAMNAGVLLGATTILIPRPVTADIFEAIGRYRPTVFPGVPTLYVAVTNDKRHTQYDLSSIDICVSGGAPLPHEVKREFERVTGGHLYEGYGLSEASPLTHAEPYDGRGRVGSMGLPVSDTEVRIVDDNDNPVPIGEEGEMVVRGPQVMRGYWKRPEDTADTLRGGWLHTGDIARMDADGWFYIVDRKKDLIITGGENIYPREVEEVLYEHPKVREAAVVGVPHPFGGEIAKAFIVLKPGEEATKGEIVQFAAQRLAKHKVPRAVEFRDELPKSAAQKILRRVLAEEERARQATRGSRRRRGAVPDEQTVE
jgi:long-chain acyl-CoA synthetase